jgi:asparagine synthetase B (glutamine-hydrolysing)
LLSFSLIDGDDTFIYKRWHITPSMLRFSKEGLLPIEDKAMRNNQIKNLLVDAVAKRVLSIPQIRHQEEGKKTIIVMFSGGLDSTLLVAIIAEVIK